MAKGGGCRSSSGLGSSRIAPVLRVQSNMTSRYGPNITPNIQPVTNPHTKPMTRPDTNRGTFTIPLAWGRKGNASH